MQPTYLYASNFEDEVRWRSSFSTIIPLLLGLFQFLLALAIIGLEIASVIISPIYGTLYAGFWAGALFLLSSVFMIGLACCHRARKWAILVFLLSLLTAAVATTLIVLNALFIGNIGRCFFAQVLCLDLLANYPNIGKYPLGKKVLILKALLGLAAVMLATALLFMLCCCLAFLRSRRRRNRVLIEHRHLPPPVIRQVVRHVSPPPPIIRQVVRQVTPPPQIIRQVIRQPTPPPPPVIWETTTIPLPIEPPNHFECPQCRSTIHMNNQRRHVHHDD